MLSHDERAHVRENIQDIARAILIARRGGHAALSRENSDEFWALFCLFDAMIANRELGLERVAMDASRCGSLFTAPNGGTLRIIYTGPRGHNGEPESTWVA